MKKQLKKWAGGLGIYFNKEEIKANNLNEGDFVEVEPQHSEINILFKDKEEINWKDLRGKVENEKNE